MRLPISPLVGIFCKFGFLEDNRPVRVPVCRKEVWIRCLLSNLSNKEVSVLASSDNCPIQALSYSNHAFSVQFHPEVVDETIQKWISIPKIKQDFDKAIGLMGITETMRYQNNNSLRLMKGAELIYRKWLKLIKNN